MKSKMAWTFFVIIFVALAIIMVLGFVSISEIPATPINLVSYFTNFILTFVGYVTLLVLFSEKMEE